MRVKKCQAKGGVANCTSPNCPERILFINGMVTNAATKPKAVATPTGPVTQSSILSARKVQPGHKQDFVLSERQWTNDFQQHLVQELTENGHEVEVTVVNNGGLKAKKEKQKITIAVDGEPTWEIEEHPRDLAKFFTEDGRGLGINPEMVVRNIKTNRLMFFEVKEQKEHGNAEERAAKLFTRKFAAELHEVYPHLEYHPYMVIFYKNLATDARYTEKFKKLFYDEEYILMNGSAQQQARMSAVHELLGKRASSDTM